MKNQTETSSFFQSIFLRLDNLSSLGRLALVVGASLIYLLVFYVLYPRIQDLAGALVCLPVFIFAWFFGMRKSFWAILVFPIINTVLLYSMNRRTWLEPFLSEDVPIYVGIIIIAIMIGRSGDLWREARQQIIRLKQAEQTVRERDELFQNFLSQSKDGILITDQAGNILEWSHGMERIFGVDREAVKNKLVWEVIDSFFPTERPSSEHSKNGGQTSRSATINVSTSRISEPFEHTVTNPSGRKITVQQISFWILNSQGRLLGSIFRDITPLKDAQEKIIQSQAALAKYVQSSPTAISMSTLFSGLFLDINDGMLNLLGYKRQEMIGHTIRELNILPDLVERDMLLQAYHEKRRIVSEEMRFRRKNGEIGTGLATLELIKYGGETCLLAIIIDITQRILAEKLLIESEEKYRSLTDQLAIGVYRISPDGVFIHANPVLASTLGYSKEDLPSSIYNLFVDETEPERFLAQIGSNPGTNFFETRFKKGTGEEIWAHIGSRVIFDENGSIKYIDGTLEDVTWRKQNEHRLSYNSTHDPLTHLFNRAYFESKLGHLENSDSYPFGIIYADVDQLKKINDTMGHSAGDMLLKFLAEILKSSVRADDTVARIGGDEFAIILPNTGEPGALAVINRFRKGIAEYNAANPEFTMSASLGYAIGEEGMSVREVLEKADQEMYAAKKVSHERLQSSAATQ